MKKVLTFVFVSFVWQMASAQTLKMQYSFDAIGDALFFRYDPRMNAPMSNYVNSIRDWTELLSNEPIQTEEIFSRLDPKFMMLQGRLAGNLHLSSRFLKITGGVSTGRYEFRNFSWHGEALFRYQFGESDFSMEVGYAMISDRSFGPEAAIRSAGNTPSEIKQKMRVFMTEKMFERPMSRGLRANAWFNLYGTPVDIGVNVFIDFVKRPDFARNDHASLTARVRLEAPDVPLTPKI